MRRLLVISLLILSLLIVPTILQVARAEPQQPLRTITVAVDLAHGESDKYLNYIMGNLTFVNWKTIPKGTTITNDILNDVDILLIGQPTVAFAPSELDAIYNWINTGHKVLYIAGDSDYGPGPTTIDNVNKVLEYIGAKLRLEQASVYSDPSMNYTYKGTTYPTCAQAYYRMLAFVEPDNIPGLYTWMLDQSITKPIIMHGAGAVIWVDDQGNYHDPVKETFPGLIRIAWFHKAYIGDNNPPAPYVYNPIFYGQGAGWFDFIGYAAEYWSDKNVVITVASESLYGDYEPAWASLYYGVPLDGPRFVENLLKWWIKVVMQPSYMAENVLEVSDPTGDDKGQGTILYPTNTVFKPGVFDLVNFKVLQDEDFIYLQVKVGDLGGNPWNGPNGFSLQHVQIYIGTTNKSLPVNTSTFGLHVDLAPGWNYAIIAVPGWGNTPYPDGEVSALYGADNKLIVDEYNNTTLFDVYAYTDINIIEVKIAKSLLSDVDNIGSWIWYVFLTSYDGFGELKIRSIQAGDPGEWALGGGDATAILAGVQPKVVDLLAPTDQDQYNMLKSYDASAGKLAVVYGIKGGVIYYPPVTVTVTTTVTTTVTDTVTSTVSTTITTTKTDISTSTQYVSETVTQPDMTITGIAAVVALIVGLAIGMLLKRK
ncbi:glucodextranase DOMON-like domain-containing protein [Desulfurococcus amylolyticus]|uniref:glucodextranase DOMON-like domain-containing protein n=1 Tax=Desulfurococcus amylolyticus TaxID=94694 RepID=UPI0023EF5E22|nr:glucodextranase DOMON-like domain-containing protein [Desulfurococcus amylolyticus]